MDTRHRARRRLAVTEPAEPLYEADRDMEAPSEVGDTSLTEARIRRGKAERLRGLIVKAAA